MIVLKHNPYTIYLLYYKKFFKELHPFHQVSHMLILQLHFKTGYLLENKHMWFIFS